MQKTSRYYIYIIRPTGRQKPIKVGYASNLRLRFSGLQCDSPKLLTVAGLFAVVGKAQARLLERTVHRAFETSRMHGEWFMIEPREALEVLESTARTHNIMFLKNLPVTLMRPKYNQRQRLIRLKRLYNSIT
jgi:hypothetical protein